jgi:hypothetical protein
MRLPAAAEQTRAQRKREKAWWTLAGPDEGISEEFYRRGERSQVFRATPPGSDRQELIVSEPATARL